MALAVKTVICLLVTIISSSKNITFALPMATKTALVTGSTDGIGLTTAKNLAMKGYNVIVHGRNVSRIERARDIVQSFAGKQHGNILSVQSDISTVESCRSLAKKVDSLLSSNNLSLDLLINNAGVFEDNHQFTDDDLEMTFAVNVMAPFVITSNLLPKLLQSKSSPSRIVIASSISQCSRIDYWDDLHCKERRYNTHQAYSESKLLDAMLTFEFAHLLQTNGFGTNKITCNCLDPGTVNTKMLLAGWGPCGIDVEDALDETWLSTSEDVKDVTGTYFCARNKRKASQSAYSTSERAKLWSVLSSIDPNSAEQWQNLVTSH